MMKCALRRLVSMRKIIAEIAVKGSGFKEIVAHDCYHICFPKSCCIGKHAWLVLLVDGWVRTNLTLTMWAK